MAVSQYMFDLQEVVTALIKHQGIHEGVWMLNVNFVLTASNIGGQGPNQETVAKLRPGIVATVDGLALTPATSDPGVVKVDAAKVNPKA